jgi:hypothetical protein
MCYDKELGDATATTPFPSQKAHPQTDRQSSRQTKDRHIHLMCEVNHSLLSRVASVLCSLSAARPALARVPIAVAASRLRGSSPCGAYMYVYGVLLVQHRTRSFLRGKKVPPAPVLPHTIDKTPYAPPYALGLQLDSPRLSHKTKAAECG